LVLVKIICEIKVSTCYELTIKEFEIDIDLVVIQIEIWIENIKE